MNPASTNPALLADYEILLIGNYQLDRQMSMLRYHDMLLGQLIQRGIAVQNIAPAPWFGGVSAGPLNKWLRYLDKYLLFPIALRKRIRELTSQTKNIGRRLIVHITDHSNAPYREAISDSIPLIATCHDLLAVRGALGEDTDCPASRFGKILQARILANLREMEHVVCVSSATASDLARLAPATSSSVILLPLNQPYALLDSRIAADRLAHFPALLAHSYILHVGSSLRRKNRAGILRIYAKIADRLLGHLVFAGEKLPLELRRLATELGIADRVVEIVNPGGPLLEALYNRAHAFLFPSKTEGFGWPIIEAQACGCPVLVARTTSLPEVVGAGGLIRELDDEEGFASDLLALQNPEFRQTVIGKGFQNIARFSTDTIIDQYLAIYQKIVKPNHENA